MNFYFGIWGMAINIEFIIYGIISKS
jgi:hypothetical protein